MSVDILRCTVGTIEAAPALLAEYAQESGMSELGEPRAQFGLYHLLEQSEIIHPVGAFADGHLVGFILPVVAVLPHYGALAGTVESFFVASAERKKGVGLRLLAYAEQLARDLGAKALLVSAPAQSQLSDVLARHKRYRHSNSVFVTALA